MKVPNISGNVAPGQGAPCIGTNSNQAGYAGQNSGFLGGFGRMNSPQRSQQSAQNPMSGPGGAVGDNAAFKPFYKRYYYHVFFATNYLRVVWCKVISAPSILGKFCSTNVVQVVGHFRIA